MRSVAVMRTPRVRALAFAMCAACTVWLVIQNSVLLSLIGWERLSLSVPASLVTHAMLNGVMLTLVAPLAFALGWMASRRAPQARSHQEVAHD